MKILHVIDELKIGGAQTHLLTMLEAARRYPTFRHRIIGLTEDGPMTERLQASGFDVRALGLRASIREHRFDRIGRALARIIRDERPDVVEAHLTFSRLIALPAAWTLGVPVRIGFEQGDVYFKSLKFRAANFALQYAAHKIVVCSAALGDWVRHTHGVDAERLWVLHNCVDILRFTPQHPPREPRFGFEGETTVFAAVGSLGHGVNKRVDVAIRAIALARAKGADVALLIVGDGAQKEALVELARSLGVAERTRFLGTRSDISEILRSCDAFCHAAPFEPFGIVCVEAMAAGLPVVVPDRGGMREAVTGDRTGIIYPVLDAEALADAMQRLAANPDLRRNMGIAGRQLAEARFSSDAYIHALYAGYAELLARRGQA